MKFILEFVWCCGSPGCCSRPGAAAEEDETRWLEPSRPARRSGRRRRGRMGPAEAGPEWKPSLCAISEDKAVLVVIEKEKAVDNQTVGSEGSPRIVKRKAGSHVRVHVRSSYSDDYGRTHVPVAIPAFSPTPFMF
ncbi:uncharacterized protein LOC132187601 [Corylus avellana]|uniref:uncharacterized protein LOC132187601 n=1 Tax=Corylus avellana TaxID=13451 RepID=UPI001E2255AB|nr:uncharacterized protein LOC132187601 [Corylus avellana]